MARLLAAISWIQCCYVKSNVCLLMMNLGKSSQKVQQNREGTKRSSYDKLPLKKRKKNYIIFNSRDN